MVEIFKTTIHEKELAAEILQKLSKQFPSYVLNFDLEDCDKILRVEGDAIHPNQIVSVLAAEGCYCELIE